MPVTVAVVSPYEVTRRGLAAMLDGVPDRVRAQVVSTRVEDAGLVDVVLYDLAGLQQPETLDQLAGLLTGTAAVLGLEVPGRSDLVERALALGISFSVPRSVTTERLLDALERTARGDVVSTVDYRAAKNAIVHRRHGLTDREATILALIAAGLSNVEIAQELYLSINSVKTYIRTAYRRIGVNTRSEAVLWTLRHNLGAADPRQRDRG
jgi:two-component system, NarL family, response regulator LiaR